MNKTQTYIFYLILCMFVACSVSSERNLEINEQNRYTASLSFYNNTFDKRVYKESEKAEIKKELKRVRESLYYLIKKTSPKA